MSAFVFLDNAVTRVRTARGARAWLLALLTLLGPGVAFAQTANSIDSMTVSKGTSGRTIVKFTLKNPPANPPAGFAIATPPRIALDFMDTANGLGTNQRAVEDVALRSVNVVQAGTRTRVVFNLNRPQTFETQVEATDRPAVRGGACG
jgi:type IV pilus assembly protein PilQ